MEINKEERVFYPLPRFDLRKFYRRYQNTQNAVKAVLGRMDDLLDQHHVQVTKVHMNTTKAAQSKRNEQILKSGYSYIPGQLVLWNQIPAPRELLVKSLVLNRRLQESLGLAIQKFSPRAQRLTARTTNYATIHFLSDIVPKNYFAQQNTEPRAFASDEWPLLNEQEIYDAAIASSALTKHYMSSFLGKELIDDLADQAIRSVFAKEQQQRIQKQYARLDRFMVENFSDPFPEGTTEILQDDSRLDYTLDCVNRSSDTKKSQAYSDGSSLES